MILERSRPVPVELCSLFGVILADGERLYDPGAYHDPLLLGLSGIMSEAD